MRGTAQRVCTHRAFFPACSRLLGLEVPRRRRHLHLRHHAIGESSRRREGRQLDQLQNHLALALRQLAAQGAIAEVKRALGPKETLGPKLQLVGGEVHLRLIHTASLTDDPPALVSLTPILQINPQFIAGPMDIRLHGSKRQLQGFRDFLVGIPLHVAQQDAGAVLRP